ncbi:MAG: PAS domain S-box protein [Steroidobacteraceae bacterium]
MSTPIERVELLAAEAPSALDPLVQAAFDAAADGIAVLQLDGNALQIVRANRRLAELLGVEAGLLRGAAVTDFTDAAGVTVLTDLASMLARGQVSRAGELVLRPATLRQRWMRVTLTALRGSGQTGLAVATFTDISDRRSIDAVTATLPVELIGLDRDLRIRWANPAAARAANLSVEQMLGRDWLEFMPSAVPRREIYEQVLAGASFDFEAVPFSRKSGCVRWYQTALRPLRDADGSISGLLAMARDVTDRVTARTAIEQAEQRFAAMIRGSHDIITIVDAAGRLMFVSPSAERILGVKTDAMVGHSLFEWVHRDDLPLLRERFGGAMAVEGRSDLPPVAFRVRHRDGHFIWLETTSTNLSKDAAVGGLLSVSRDITQRRADEAAMADSRAKLDLALNGAAVGTWEYDVISGVHRFDARCARILGIEREEVVADLQQLASMTHPDDIVSAREALVKHLRGDIDWYETEYRARDSAGVWRWVAARGRATGRDDEGRVRRMAGVLLDIDARKRAEHAVRIQTALLEMAAADGQIGLWSWNPVTNERTANESWCLMTGYSMEEWRSQDDPWPQRAHPEDRANTLEALQALVEGAAQQMAEDVEFRFHTKDGDWRWFAARARVVERDSTGRTTRVVRRTLDITSQNASDSSCRKPSRRPAWAAGNWTCAPVNCRGRMRPTRCSRRPARPSSHPWRRPSTVRRRLPRDDAGGGRCGHRARRAVRHPGRVPDVQGPPGLAAADQQGRDGRGPGRASLRRQAGRHRAAAHRCGAEAVGSGIARACQQCTGLARAARSRPADPLRQSRAARHGSYAGRRGAQPRHRARALASEAGWGGKRSHQPGAGHGRGQPGALEWRGCDLRVPCGTGDRRRPGGGPVRPHHRHY